MPMHRGDIYGCPDPDCGCELTVTRGVKADGGGDLPPRCCCGKAMERKIETSMRV